MTLIFANCTKVEAPYRATLSGEDLLKFLQTDSGRYSSFVISVPYDEYRQPCIEVSRGTCQELIMLAMESEQKRLMSK